MKIQSLPKKNTFSTCTLIAAWYLSIKARNLLPPWHKLDLARFFSRHKYDSSSIYWTLRISKNQQREKAHNLFVWNPNWDLFEPVFKGHYKPSISRLFREINTMFMRLGFCNQVFFISPNQRVLITFLVCLWVI